MEEVTLGGGGESREVVLGRLRVEEECDICGELGRAEREEEVGGRERLSFARLERVRVRERVN